VPAAGFIAPPGYQRHRPEATLLYQLVAEHYPTFRDRRASEERPLPRYVEDEFEAYLKCGRLEHGFFRVKCESCQAEKLVAFSCKRRGFCPSCGGRRMAETAGLLVDDVLPRQPVRHWVLSLPVALRYLLATRPEVVTQVLGIVYRAISGHLIRKAGLTRASGVTGAVTLIQRFGSALNLNVHLHMLVLDGVYRREGEGSLQFVPVSAPGPTELQRLVQRIAERIGRSLERSGLITRDIENAYLAFDPGAEESINGLLGASITYRIATGPREGQKVFTLQTLQTLPAEPDEARREVAESSGLSLHAGIAAKASQRDKLEHHGIHTRGTTTQASVWRHKGHRAVLNVGEIADVLREEPVYLVAAKTKGEKSWPATVGHPMPKHPRRARRSGEGQGGVGAARDSRSRLC